MARMNPWAIACAVLLLILAFNARTGSKQSARYTMGALEEKAVGGYPGDATVSMDRAYLGEAMPPAIAPQAGGVNAIPVASGGSGGGTSPMQLMQQSETDRFLIRNGSLTLEVKDPAQAARAIEQLALTHQGYTGELNESVDHLQRKMISLSLRVPAKDFERVIADIEKLGSVIQKYVSAEDVTEQFVDTQARIRNLRDTEARLLAHLADSKKLSDTLDVEREITRIRGELEGLEGRLKFLAHRISFSTLSVTLQPEPGPEPLRPAYGFSTRKEFTAALRDLVMFGQGIWAQVIWLGVWSVVWLPLLLIGRWLWLKISRARLPRKAPLAQQ